MINNPDGYENKIKSLPYHLEIGNLNALNIYQDGLKLAFHLVIH